MKDKVPNFFLGYIYYRLASYFIKKDGDQGYSAIILISLVECVFLLSIVKQLFFEFDNFLMNKGEHRVFAGYIAVVIAAIMLYFNSRFFNGRYSHYQSFWGAESKDERRRNGVWVIMFFVLPLVLLFI